MKVLLWIAITTTLAQIASANPEADRKAFASKFHSMFPKVKHESYIDGIYAIDAPSRSQWLEIEEFAPYEPAIDDGKELFEKPFANGNSYKDCFPMALADIRQAYPYFDLKTHEVITLELDLNRCRQKNGEKLLKYKKGPIADLSSYLAFVGRDRPINTQIPESTAALSAYDKGKEYFYTKRGQLNFACVDCHVTYSGRRLRADRLSPALGHPSHFPVYRSKWGSMGTLHRRFAGCNKQVGAEPLKAQSKTYRNLEFYLSYMSNGLLLNGPGSRK